MWGSDQCDARMPNFCCEIGQVGQMGKVGRWAKWAKCALGTLKGSTVFVAEALGREPAKRLHGSGAGWQCRRRRGDCDHFNDTCDRSCVGQAVASTRADGAGEQDSATALMLST